MEDLQDLLDQLAALDKDSDTYDKDVKALDKKIALQEKKVEAEANAMLKSEPTKGSVRGEIASISSLIEGGFDDRGESKDYRIYTIASSKGKKTFAIGWKQIKQNEELLQLDACVDVEYEKTIAGVTKWSNPKKGTSGTHKSTSENVTRITRVSMKDQMEALLESRASKAEAKIMAADDTKTIALATLYGALYRV
jgi:hypothetical protein